MRIATRSPADRQISKIRSPRTICPADQERQTLKRAPTSDPMMSVNKTAVAAVAFAHVRRDRGRQNEHSDGIGKGWRLAQRVR
jgi:hypothetical protein